MPTMQTLKFGFTAKQIIDEGRTSDADIQLIRAWLETHKLPNLTDEQIIFFLLSCDNQQEATKATIKAFYSMRRKAPEIFRDRNLQQRSDLQTNLEVSHLCVLPERSDDGCAIIVSRLFDTNYRNAHMELYLTNMCMAIDAALYDNPPKGLIILNDMKGMGVMHMTAIKLGLFRAFLQYLQEGLPVKVKDIHIMNCYGVFNKIMALGRPFCKKEVIEKIHFHSTSENMELFYENWLPKRCLPEDYGGDLPSINVLRKNHIQKVIDMQEYFEAEEQQREDVVM